MRDKTMGCGASQNVALDSAECLKRVNATLEKKGFNISFNDQSKAKQIYRVFENIPPFDFDEKEKEYYRAIKKLCNLSAFGDYSFFLPFAKRDYKEGIFFLFDFFKINRCWLDTIKFYENTKGIKYVRAEYIYVIDAYINFKAFASAETIIKRLIQRKCQELHYLLALVYYYKKDYEQCFNELLNSKRLKEKGFIHSLQILKKDEEIKERVMEIEEKFK